MQIHIFIARCGDIKLRILPYCDTVRIYIFFLHIFAYIRAFDAQTNFHRPIISTFWCVLQIHRERILAMLDFSCAINKSD
jgi:hypothetical protein